MPVINAFNQKAVRIPVPFDRNIRVLLAPDTQDIVKGISICHCIIPPGGRTDTHTHPGVEMMYIISGYGEAKMGDEMLELKPDVLLVAPPGVVHDIRNYSEETMKFVPIFIPGENASAIYERANKAAAMGVMNLK